MCVCVCVFFGAMKGRCQLCGRHWKVDLNARIPMLKYLSTTYKNKLVRCGLLQWGRRFCSKVLPHPRSNPFNVEFIMKESNRASWNLIWMWIKVSHMMLDKDYPFYPPPLPPLFPLNVTWGPSPESAWVCRIVRWLWWINSSSFDAWCSLGCGGNCKPPQTL